MKRLVVDLCDVRLAGAAGGRFLVVVSGKPWADCEEVSSRSLITLRMFVSSSQIRPQAVRHIRTQLRRVPKHASSTDHTQFCSRPDVADQASVSVRSVRRRTTRKADLGTGSYCIDIAAQPLQTTAKHLLDSAYVLYARCCTISMHQHGRKFVCSFQTAERCKLPVCCDS